MKLLILSFLTLYPSVGLCSPLMAPNYEAHSMTGDTSTSGVVSYPVEAPSSILRDLGVTVGSEHTEDRILESRATDWSQLHISDDCVRCATSAAASIGATIFNGNRIIRGSVATARFASFALLTGHTFATDSRPAEDKTQSENDWIVFVTGG
ncbi:hypothetical protein PSPO01_16183 [Paraphaeosphaeria sporulosa]